ncbi:hypothetical protein K1719_024272 [Acacia pycnantha]|nr:hypothetical protein K1719_024272 [Acacia pycnantha]
MRKMGIIFPDSFNFSFCLYLLRGDPTRKTQAREVQEFPKCRYFVIDVLIPSLVAVGMLSDNLTFLCRGLYYQLPLRLFSIYGYVLLLRKRYLLRRTPPLITLDCYFTHKRTEKNDEQMKVES